MFSQRAARVRRQVRRFVREFFMPEDAAAEWTKVAAGCVLIWSVAFFLS